MSKINLPVLIIIWWVGAIIAACSLLIPVYRQYVLLGTVGWSIVVGSTILIIYKIKRIKVEDKKRQLAENGI